MDSAMQIQDVSPRATTVAFVMAEARRMYAEQACGDLCRVKNPHKCDKCGSMLRAGERVVRTWYMPVTRWQAHWAGVELGGRRALSTCSGCALKLVLKEGVM